MSNTTQSVHKEDLVVTRIIDAPLELVWKAWTDPEHVMKWWGPKYYTSPSCKIDLREGGKYVFCMRAPQEQGNRILYGGSSGKCRWNSLNLPRYLIKTATQSTPTKWACLQTLQAIRTVVTFAFSNDMTELTVTEYAWR
jgi:uncharacterized protein YndB with AHSA1/START domain